MLRYCKGINVNLINLKVANIQMREVGNWNQVVKNSKFVQYSSTFFEYAEIKLEQSHECNENTQ